MHGFGFSSIAMIFALVFRLHWVKEVGHNDTEICGHSLFALGNPFASPSTHSSFECLNNYFVTSLCQPRAHAYESWPHLEQWYLGQPQGLYLRHFSMYCTWWRIQKWSNCLSIQSLWRLLSLIIWIGVKGWVSNYIVIFARTLFYSHHRLFNLFISFLRFND